MLAFYIGKKSILIRDGKNPGFIAKTLPTRVLLVKYGFNTGF